MGVLVAGSTGFVGRHLTKALLEEGYKTYALYRKEEKLKLLPKGVIPLKTDFSFNSLKEIFSQVRPKFFINLVGILYERRRGDFYRVHHQLTKTFVELCKEYKVEKILHMSALGTQEGAPSNYHRSKLLGEREVINSGLRHTIFRPSLILGYGQRLFYDVEKYGKLFHLFLVPNSGKFLFQPVDVRDVVFAFISSLNKEDTDGKILCLCGRDRVTFKELLRDTLRLLGIRALIIPFPKWALYYLGFLVERLIYPPPFTPDQMLMMSKDNVCEENHLKMFKEPIGYKESLSYWIKFLTSKEQEQKEGT